MNNKQRLYLPLIMILSMTGCSAIHNGIGPDRKQSELREQIEAPISVSIGETPICVVKQTTPSPQKQIVSIAAPYNAKLFFLLNQAVFSPDSQKESKEVYQMLVKRNDSKIIISGHTDTSASNAYNDALSERRVEKVRQDLIELGISADIIQSSSEGENRLLVQTPDGVVEALNRRVEINVR